MLSCGPCPVYSLDASAFIDFRPFRRDVFGSMWQLAGELADDRRLLMCEEASKECRDPELKQFIQTHPGMIVRLQDYHEHFRQLQAEAPIHGIELVNPSSTRDRADPFVVALALALEQRGVGDLRVRTNPSAVCAVVTHELPKGPGAKYVKIPNACSFYGLQCIDWQELLLQQGYHD